MHPVIVEIFEYFVITTLFALFPLFTAERTQFAPIVPQADQLLFYGVSAVLLYLRGEKAYRRNGENRFTRFERCNFVCNAGRAFLCFCALACSALWWNRIANKNGTQAVRPILPGIPQQIFLLIAGTLIFACYEEMLFRFFLPEKALSIIGIFNFNDREKANYRQNRRTALTTRAVAVAAELIPIVLFALAHRYLGIYAVCNALCAAVILRVALHKKVHIFALCFIHCAYNISVFITMSRIY